MKSEQTGNPISVQLGIPFELRSPSTTWELLSVTAPMPFSLWVWFKPEHTPAGIVIRIPDEVWQQAPLIPFTIRQLVQSLEIPSENILAWYLYGYTCEGMDGSNPQLDLIIPPPAMGIDPAITINLQSPASQNITPAVTVSAANSSEGMANVFEKIEADWIASLQLEVQLVALRKQVVGTLSRLGSLNRDLTSEEQQHGDRQDVTEWQDARRWIRDSLSRLSRLMKDLDLGITSTAGKRNWFEQTYQQFVVPRQQFDEIEQTQRDFEVHHKALQTLLSRLTVANKNAGTDGIGRAQRILTRITAKARKSRTKRK